MKRKSSKVVKKRPLARAFVNICVVKNQFTSMSQAMMRTNFDWESGMVCVMEQGLVLQAKDTRTYLRYGSIKDVHLKEVTNSRRILVLRKMNEYFYLQGTDQAMSRLHDRVLLITGLVSSTPNLEPTPHLERRYLSLVYLDVHDTSYACLLLGIEPSDLIKIEDSLKRRGYLDDKGNISHMGRTFVKSLKRV